MAAYDGLPAIRETFAEASDVLGEDLWKLVESGPAEQLNLTVNTQPVMLIAGVAVFRAWRASGGPMPAMMAGHSLGEYSALVAAGAMDFGQAAKLVRFRAQSMQEAVPAGTGAMAAILGLDDEGVRAACAEASRGAEVAEAANFNAPGQVVVAGSKPAVERAIAAAKAKGAKRAMLLAMSAPSHCSLMKPAADRLRERLAQMALQLPTVPVYQNATLEPARSVEALKDALVRQVQEPVRWVDNVRALRAAGAKLIAECGPGKALFGMNKRIAEDATSLALADAASFGEALKLAK
jgi:[acyl-carrier-protein] S-malonyltransferase